jgi:hypothetical protein
MVTQSRTTLKASDELRLLSERQNKFLKQIPEIAKLCLTDPQEAARRKNRLRRHTLHHLHRAVELRLGGAQA